MWRGDLFFLLETLILKDFRIRYRTMSLGVLWSLLNPLVMMGVITFVWTVVFPNPTVHNFPIFVLCGLVPYSFFTIALLSGTTSIVDSSTLIKRVPVPREVVPIASVLSNGPHLLIQIMLLLGGVIAFGMRPNVYWLWLPLIWALEIFFVCGLALFTSAINVFIRDTRYVVESGNTVLFWLVPIFYGFSDIPQKYSLLYEVNPVAALVLAMRSILLDGKVPHFSTMRNLVIVSTVTFAMGLVAFRKLKPAFYDHI